jgi:ABC-type lipoprotein export system ATPase subunit
VPRFDIVKTTNADETFKVEQVKGAFDLQTSTIQEHFTGDIAIEGKEWSIGLIVGRSGTGKTTIAKEVFADGYIEPHTYGTAAIVNEMPNGLNYADITKMFTAVGFSSPPSWLKPYSVLSNGEKMRVDLARALLEERDVIVFDEYTSVVDRDVAKVCSLAVNKAIRNQHKKFIAVSCHDDIIEWLQPDWVYDTNQQTFSFRDGHEKRPEIKVDVFDTHRNARLWPLFGKYHYLNTEVKRGTDIFVGCINNAPVAFCAVRHFPHPKNSRLKMVHRLVVLPDYQGIGIGTRFLGFVADLYTKRGFTMRLVTSQVSLINSLTKHGWRMVYYGHQTRQVGGLECLKKANSIRRITASFKYAGGS